MTLAPAYPGRPLRVGLRADPAVRLVQERLNQLGLGPLRVSGDFRDDTERCVRDFQRTSNDTTGRRLIADAVVGPATWRALFGPGSTPASACVGPELLRTVLAVAAREQASRVREAPPRSNSGPRVDEYLASVGLAPGNSWCAAFVHWCFARASATLGVANPCFRTGGVLRHWRAAFERSTAVVTQAAVRADASLVRPGHIFVIQTNERGQGHTGLIEALEAGKLITLEGNTDPAGSREGGGVYRRTRKLAEINKGFIDYGVAPRQASLPARRAPA